MKIKIIIVLLIVIAISESESQTDCGTHKTLRPIIIGGNLTVKGEHPWKAALFKDDELFCGGSLVSKKAVVTSAHCIRQKGGTHEYKADQITVVLGALDILKTHEKGRVTVGVESIQVHPDWNTDDDNYDGDIALLILDTEVQYSPTIQPICLSKPQSIAAQATEGIVIGYGLTEDKKTSNIAKKLKVPIKNYRKCGKEHNRLKPLLTARTFCGGPGDGRGICQGDSGSGLYVLHNKQFYLRGTASASSLDTLGECDVKSFAVFVDTTDYCGWIQSDGTNKYAQCTENDFSTATTRTTTSKPRRKTTTRYRGACHTTSIAAGKNSVKDVLYGGECLYADEFIESQNHCFKVYYQGDGNFVNYRYSSPLWSSGSQNTCIRCACMQGDGNFVVYDCHSKPQWASNTVGNPGARLVIQNDGNLVLYSTNNAALWNSGTMTTC
ncbi:trypsin-5-like [Chironomus tepperi]|uniref:trypsin-5-like n=1 Tax=Chironomus tepperi TaxID=113505 RepID=UPI00391FC4D0